MYINPIIYGIIIMKNYAMVFVWLIPWLTMKQTIPLIQRSSFRNAILSIQKCHNFATFFLSAVYTLYLYWHSSFHKNLHMMYRVPHPNPDSHSPMHSTKVHFYKKGATISWLHDVCRNYST